MNLLSKAMFMALAVAAFASFAVVGFGAGTANAQVVEEPPEGLTRATICHATSSEGNPYNFLSLPPSALFGPAGHFNENGTPQAGHEEDFVVSYFVGEVEHPVNEVEGDTCALVDDEETTVTFRKDCDPEDITTVFTIEVTEDDEAVLEFDISCGESLTFRDVEPGEYDLEEIGATGFTTSFSEDCAGGTIVVEAEDDLLCVITNVEVETLVTFRKDCDPEDVTTVFTIEVTEGGEPEAEFDISCGETLEFDDVPAGEYDLEEVGATGFTTSFSEDCVGGTLVVEAGDDLLCVIKNVGIQPVLTIEKVCPHGGANAAVFTISVDGASQVFQCGTKVEMDDLDVGEFTISEVITGADAQHFKRVIIACTDGTIVHGASADVDLGFGDEVTCFVINILDRPDIIVDDNEIKIIVENVINNVNENDNVNVNENTQNQTNEQNTNVTTGDVDVTSTGGSGVGGSGTIKPPSTGSAGLADKDSSFASEWLLVTAVALVGTLSLAAVRRGLTQG